MFAVNKNSNNIMLPLCGLGVNIPQVPEVHDDQFYFMKENVQLLLFIWASSFLKSSLLPCLLLTKKLQHWNSTKIHTPDGRLNNKMQFFMLFKK